MHYIGIDLSARRGFDVATLDEGQHLTDLWRVPTLDLLLARLADAGEAPVVAVDAPQGPSDFPLRRSDVRVSLPVPPRPRRYTRYRVCDYELARRHIPLYLLPEPGGVPPAWMALGFATFARLRDQLGLRLPAHAHDATATLLEVYPYAGFVVLLGRRPPRKTTIAGAVARREALDAAGVQGLPAARLSHDALDAVCAAQTAWAWRQGRGCAMGLPHEGLIALPVPLTHLRERYH